MTAYHVSRNRKTLGVYPEADARDYYAQGRIGPDDLVWCEGMPAWVAASEVFGPAPQAAAAVAPAVPFPASEPPLPPTAPAASPQLEPQPEPQASAAPSTSQPPVPLPPNLHWGLVLLFTVLTLGIFYVVWSFIQAAWVRKIHPASNAITLLAVYVVLFIAGELITAASGEGTNGAAAGSMLVFSGTIVSVVAAFSMRRSMLDYYNRVEPIGLRLSAALTFFIGPLYLQYHLTRIARWKQSGVLPL